MYRGYYMAVRKTSIDGMVGERVLKDARINLRGTSAQLGSIRRAAESSQKSLTEFILESAATAAERVLADRREFILDAKAGKAFQAALERPAILKPRLQTLLGEADPFVD